jgi:hypothetical protein
MQNFLLIGLETIFQIFIKAKTEKLALIIGQGVFGLFGKEILMSVCIFSTVNEMEAGLVKSTLEEKGINNYLQNSSSLAYLGANLPVGNIEVFVKEEDVDKALDIIKSLFGNEMETENIVESDNNNQSETDVNSEIKDEHKNDTKDEVNNENGNSNDLKKCPFCAEWIKKEAIIYRFCNRDLQIKEKAFDNLKKKTNMTHKLSAGKKFLIFIGIVIFVMILAAIFISLQKVSNRENGGSITTPKYYYEVFLVDILHYSYIEKSSNMDLHSIKTFRNNLKKSNLYLLTYATVYNSEIDLYNDFVYTTNEIPVELMDNVNKLINTINTIGNAIYINEYTYGYMLVEYFEKIDDIKIIDTVLTNSLNFNATHKVFTNDGTNLRLRNAPAFDSAQIMSLEYGSQIMVLGTIEPAWTDSDGYQGNWVYVMTPDRKLGWCFGAYLKPISKNQVDNATRPNNSQSSSNSAINVTLNELINAYRTDTNAANRKYRNKNVVITGRVTTIAYNPNRIVFETDIANFPVDDFLRGGLLGTIYSVVMVLDRQSAGKIENIGRGDTITVEGKFMGVNEFNNLQMDNCKLINY